MLNFDWSFQADHCNTTYPYKYKDYITYYASGPVGIGGLCFIHITTFLRAYVCKCLLIPVEAYYRTLVFHHQPRMSYIAVMRIGPNCTLDELLALKMWASLTALDKQATTGLRVSRCSTRDQKGYHYENPLFSQNRYRGV